MPKVCTECRLLLNREINFCPFCNNHVNNLDFVPFSKTKEKQFKNYKWI